MGNETLKQLREELLANPGVRAAYEEQAPVFAIARARIAARTGAGLSQAELAARTATSQPFVARLEGGRALPSLRTLLKIAEATGTVPEFRLKPRQVRRRTAAVRYVSPESPGLTQTLPIAGFEFRETSVCASGRTLDLSRGGRGSPARPNR